MAFDHSSGRLFWAYTGSQFLGDLYEVNPETAKVTPLGTVTFEKSPCELVGLYSVYTPILNSVTDFNTDDLKVYADESGTVHVILPFENGQTKVRIVNALGMILKQQNLQGKESLIRCDLPAGVYFAVVTTGNSDGYRLPFAVKR